MGFGTGRGKGYGLGVGRGYGRGRGLGYGRGSGRFSGYTCVKFFFFAFNVVFWLLGCAILGVGIWLHVAKGSYASLSPTFSFLSATALCITVGAVVLIIGFFGCCGAIMENQCLLMTYFLLVILITILEVTAGALSILYWNSVESIVMEEMRNGVKKKYQTKEEDGLTNAWNTLQKKLKCCGVYNYTDWFLAEAWPHKNFVPDSCCIESFSTCGQQNDVSKFYQTGCFTEIKETVVSNFYIVAIILVCVAVLQIFGVVSSIALFCCLRSDKYYE